MSGEQHRPSNEDKAQADLEYFAKLYSAHDESGEPQQTKIDKLRDGLLVRLYKKYGTVPLNQSKVLDVVVAMAGCSIILMAQKSLRE